MVQQKKEIPSGANAALVLEDGSVFYGRGIGATGCVMGEVCFNTGMTGYQEILTDLSYAGQIITFTFPHIGIVGTNKDDLESVTPAAKGLILREPITTPSNFRSDLHFNDWLKKHKLTGICGIDTRQLTRSIRINGPRNACINFFSKQSDFDLSNTLKMVRSHPSLKGMELTKSVSCNAPEEWKNQGIWKFSTGFSSNKKPLYNVVAIDYGAKLNILRCLTEVGLDVTVVPADTQAEVILSMQPDGIFLSNGPGDPYATSKFSTPILQELIASNLPIFGICMGHQLLSLALGCSTEKMHQGHRGSNHPVQDLTTGNVEITSQNHGFVVLKDTLPDDIEATHISLFDGTVEGIRCLSKPVFTVQYHPEASPGPHDSFYLFERFVALIKETKENEKRYA